MNSLVCLRPTTVSPVVGRQLKVEGINYPVPQRGKRETVFLRASRIDVTFLLGMVTVKNTIAVVHADTYVILTVSFTDTFHVFGRFRSKTEGEERIKYLVIYTLFKISI